MANPDSVSQFYLDSFGYGRVAVIQATQLNTAGNAVIALPILNGGLTKGGATANSGGIIIRRITLQNPSGSLSSAYVSIGTTNDGANLVVANAQVTLTGTGLYQDLTIASPYNGNTVVSGAVTSPLFVNINTVSGNSNTCDIRVYGDVVTF